ncbi:MAG: class I SAM-dependent methyltransferase [Gemmatimonadaceae bacterium]|nr:class I SAM-dependent methyltransferase [Gemmatimonadaceae bacterium]
MTQQPSHADDLASGARFRFGENWARFLSVLDEPRIADAERSLATRLRRQRLDGLRFVDVGSGSGLFSLAARRLGADVTSFDFDPSSVACTAEVRRRYFPDDPGWRVEEGSALDRDFIKSLGSFDVVYSWGVLHHTGAMWEALNLVTNLVGPGGQLFVALYNDQGHVSDAWRMVKRLYCASPFGKAAVLGAFLPYFAGRGLVSDVVRRRNPLDRWRTMRLERGMSFLHDIVDWLGGYPFEVANPGELHEFFRSRQFVLEMMETVGGTLGNNEFVFRRT